MRYSKVLPYVFLSLIFIAILYPDLLLVMAIVSFTATIVHSAAQLFIEIDRFVPFKKQNVSEDQPFVSIQIPIYSEPPEIVIETLRSLLQQDYGNYEIIVFDNNTPEERFWKPVESFCNGHEKISFYHQMDVEGFKAGALNLCRNLQNPKTEYIFTVDADYRVSRHCISEAIKIATRENLALVQFPQAYRNVSVMNSGLKEEFNHFFKLYLKSGNKNRTVLGTGTLSLVHVRSLDSIGGWPTSSITEDAELGTRFQLAHMKSRYIDRTMGRGIMPVEFDGLRKQRLRWIFGNFQTLKNYLVSVPNLAAIKRDCVMQLTAWINFCGIPLLLIALSVGISVFNIGELNMRVVGLSLSTIAIYTAMKYLMFFRIQKNAQKAFRALSSHLALFTEGAFGWWDATIGLKKPFIRTNKFAGMDKIGPLPFGAFSLLIGSGTYLAFLGEHIMASLSVSIGLLMMYSSLNMLTQLKEAARMADGDRNLFIENKEREMAI